MDSGDDAHPRSFYCPITKMLMKGSHEPLFSTRETPPFLSGGRPPVPACTGTPPHGVHLLPYSSLILESLMLVTATRSRHGPGRQLV
jgi:hypothetical protein